MSREDYIVSSAFYEAVDRRVEHYLRSMGIDPVALGERKRRIEQLEHDRDEAKRKLARFERYEDIARICGKALAWIGSLGAGGWLIKSTLPMVLTYF